LKERRRGGGVRDDRERDRRLFCHAPIIRSAMKDASTARDMSR
jgi:hypothetical protein